VTIQQLIDSGTVHSMMEALERYPMEAFEEFQPRGPKRKRGGNRKPRAVSDGRAGALAGQRGYASSAMTTRCRQATASGAPAGMGRGCGTDTQPPLKKRPKRCSGQQADCFAEIDTFSKDVQYGPV
jgi:hypothetical protein